MGSSAIWRLPLALSAVAASAAAEARAAGELRVVLRLAAEADRALLERVRGQTSDLPVALLPVEASPLEATLSAQVAAADALAARHRADVVVWFAHASARRIVTHVSQLATRNVLVRATDVAGGADAAPPSPALEASALVVRTALLALAEGGRIGISRSEIADTEAGADGRRLARRLGLGWIMAGDGLSPGGQHGLGGSLGLHGARLGVEIDLSATLPTPVSDEAATLALSRATLAVGAAVRQPLGQHASLTAGLQVGAAAVFRTTTPSEPGVVATPASRRLSPLVSPVLRLALTPGRLAGLGLVVGAGADYLPGLPALVYRRDGRPEIERRPWRLQPRVTVGLELVRR